MSSVVIFSFWHTWRPYSSKSLSWRLSNGYYFRKLKYEWHDSIQQKKTNILAGSTRLLRVKLSAEPFTSFRKLLFLCYQVTVQNIINKWTKVYTRNSIATRLPLPWTNLSTMLQQSNDEAVITKKKCYTRMIETKPGKYVKFKIQYVSVHKRLILVEFFFLLFLE